MEKLLTMKCEYCKKIFPRLSKRRVRHRNTQSSNGSLFFCSKRCYKQWLREIQHPNLHYYVVWKVITFFGKFKFRKQLIQSEGIIPELGPPKENSHFALDFQDEI